MERVARVLPEWDGELPNGRQPAAGEPFKDWERNMMKPQTQVDAGGLTVAAVIDMLRAVIHLLTPADRLTFVRILRDGMNMVPPETDQRLRARISVARTVPPQAVDSMATALESFVLWQQSANTTPEELRRLGSFEEHRPLYEELLAFVKILGYNLDLNHFLAIAKSRAAIRSARNLNGPEGLAAQAHLESVTPMFRRSGRKRKKSEPAELKN